MHLRVAGRWLLFTVWAFGAAIPAGGVPPPPQRASLSVDLVPNGREQVVHDTVRAYQAVTVTMSALAGDRLLLRMKDVEHVLVLRIEAPSGLPWISGAVPGPDGIDMWISQTGMYRILVLMSSDAARTGRAAHFELGLSLRR